MSGGGGEALASSTVSGEGESRHLNEVLHLLFRQFKAVVTLHHQLVLQLQRVASQRNVSDLPLYDTNDVWENIQTALQQFVGMSSFLQVVCFYY